MNNVSCKNCKWRQEYYCDWFSSNDMPNVPAVCDHDPETLLESDVADEFGCDCFVFEEGKADKDSVEFDDEDVDEDEDEDDEDEDEDDEDDE